MTTPHRTTPGEWRDGLEETLERFDETGGHRVLARAFDELGVEDALSLVVLPYLHDVGGSQRSAVRHVWTATRCGAPAPWTRRTDGPPRTSPSPPQSDGHARPTAHMNRVRNLRGDRLVCHAQPP
jgi:hypothetical protein